MLKIAAFNVENLFERAQAFNEPTEEAQRILRQTAELNDLLESVSYAGHETRIVELIGELGLDKSDQGNGAVLMRRIRGKLLKRSGGEVVLLASGRSDWIGWVEAKTDPVNETAIDNTGRVIRDVNADILAVIEADNRPALKRFSEAVLKRITPRGRPYEHVMLIDGNDKRGIDVGLMTRADYPIREVRTHIYDGTSSGNRIFSRDCPEYAVETPDDERIWILPNHFKSKYGGQASSNRKRKAQAKRTAEIYTALIDRGEANVVVLGDLNDTPGSDPMKPLLATTLKDVSEHASFDPGPFKDGWQPPDNSTGTYKLGNDNNKIDYLLLSPELYDRIDQCGLFRDGAWPGSNPPRWDVYPELTHPVHVASDHHVIWVTLIGA